MNTLHRFIAPSALCLSCIASTHAGVVTLSDMVSRPISDADPSPAPLVSLVAPSSPGAVVESVTVGIDVTHPWVGDLTVLVRHNGQEVLLIDRVAIADFPFGCGGDNISATFTDDASVSADDQCSATMTPTVSGDVLPTDALAGFNGLDLDGAWDIVVADAALYDAGSLEGVTLTITVSSPCPADFNGNGVVGSDDLAILLGAWGQSGVAADLDGGGVGSSDIAQLLGAWGSCDTGR